MNFRPKSEPVENQTFRNTPPHTQKKLFNQNLIVSKSVFLVLILFTIMILSLCFQDTINYDEYFSMQWCRLGWKDLMQKLISDVHPPLYYLILKPLLDLTNENMFCARILSAAAGIVVLWSGSLFMSRHFGKKSALFYACFLYLNPFMIQKATEIRMYMLAGMFTIISGICSYYILEEAALLKNNMIRGVDPQTRSPLRKYWICFTVSSLSAAYTHYYALLVMCFLYAGLIIYFIFTKNKNGIISWLVCAACTIILYLPWLPVALKQVSAVNQAYWISMPASRLAPLRELFYSAIPYSEHVYLCTVMLLIIFAFVRFIKEKSVDSYWTLMCSSALCGIMLFAIWYASHIRPVLISRYLIMAVCLCILGISNMVRFQNKYITMLLCLFCCLVGGIRYRSAFLTQADRITTKTVDFITENSTSDDCIVYVNDGYGYLAHCVEYYFPDTEYIGIEKEGLSELAVILSEADGSVWFFDDQGYMDDLQINITGYTAKNCGTYGFGTAGFKIYELLAD